jgi:hypothetical protein
MSPGAGVGLVLFLIFGPICLSVTFFIVSAEIREWIDWREKRRARRGGK